MENVVTSAPSLTRPQSKGALVWTGRVLTGLLAAFLFFDTFGKLVPLAPYIEGMQKSGFDVALIRPLGLALGIPTLLHLIPRTELFGALLLTAYFGGAVATHVLKGTSFWFPILCGVILWAAYAMRSERFRAFVLATIR